MGELKDISAPGVLGSRGNPLVETKEAWRVENLYVLMGDIYQFSKFMKPGLSATLTNRLRNIVKNHSESLRYFAVIGGDSVLVVHHCVHDLTKIATRIIEDMMVLPGSPKLRVAIDFGQITYEEENRKMKAVLSGDALWTTARIEPKVTPGEIWCTEFVNIELERQNGLYRAVKLLPKHAPEIEHRKGRFNIKKNGSNESDCYLRLYRIFRTHN